MPQSLHGRLHDPADPQSLRLRHTTQLWLEMVSDGAHEMHLTSLLRVVSRNVSYKEGLETLFHQLPHSRLLDMRLQERYQRGQEAVGERLPIHLLQNRALAQTGLLVKGLLHRQRQLVLHHIAHQQLPQYGSTAFVA